MLSESVSSAVAEHERRRRATAGDEAWLKRRDVLVTGLIVALGLVGLCLSHKLWPAWAGRLAERRLNRSAGLSDEERATIGVVLGKSKGDKAERNFRRDVLRHKYLSWIQLLACYRPWGWRPRPKLIGQRHLDEALAKGGGVVLFTANFIYKDLMSKAALANEGYKACHLTRDSHGFSESWLGKRLLNPIHSRIEARFLGERLVFSGNQTRDVNALIKERLRQNQPILVTVTPLGRRVSVLPFLHGRIRIATGALNFAAEAGATVLPVFTIRRPNGDIDVIIEHPLKGQKEEARQAVIQAMLEDYVPRLETYVAQYPDQFAFPISSRYGDVLIEPTERTAERVGQKGAVHGTEVVSEPA